MLGLQWRNLFPPAKDGSMSIVVPPSNRPVGRCLALGLSLWATGLPAVVAASPSPAPAVGRTPSVITAPAAMPITLRFAARVNGVAFACGKKYPGVGATKAVYEPQDFRMYVARIALVRATGEVVPVTLIEDGTWQQRDVALLDFEDGTALCQNGTPQVHREIAGKVPGYSDYTGVRFAMAVPFDLDHQDASAASPPFDQAGLFWGWQAGYKFLTLDGRIDDQHGHSVHVASTGCEMAVPGQVSGCRAPNEVTVSLANFDVHKSTIVADIGHLLAQSNLQPLPKPRGPAGKPMSHVALANGCMSEPYNSNCAPIFANLGLAFGEPPAHPAGQRFFTVE